MCLVCRRPGFASSPRTSAAGSASRPTPIRKTRWCCGPRAAAAARCAGSRRRTDSIAGDNHGRDQVVHAELALDAHGKILAIRTHALHAVGAYIVSAAVAPLVYSLRYTPGVYDVQTLWLTTKAVFTHTSPLGVYRGAGRPEGNYVIERLLDRAAAVLGIGQDEIRRRNFIAPKAMPYTTPTGSVYDSGEFERLMDECMRLADWKGYKARQAQSKGHRQGARPLGELLHRARRHLQRNAWACTSTRAATSPSWPAPIRTARATPLRSRNSSANGSAFRSTAIRYLQGDTDKVAVRTRHLRGAQRRARRLGAAACRRRDHRQGQTDGGPSARKPRRPTSTSSRGDSACAGPIAASRWSIPPRRSTRRSCRRASRLGLRPARAFDGHIPSYPNGCHVCEVELDPVTGRHHDRSPHRGRRLRSRPSTR